MVSLLMAVALSSVTSDQQLHQKYAEAYEQSVREQKPLMVVVGAPWCPACNVLKETTIKSMAKTGELDAVSLTMVNRDEDPELAQQLTKGERMLPQIIVYTPQQTGTWKRRKLTGYQLQEHNDVGLPL